MLTLQVVYSGIDGWTWTIRHNGYIVDAGHAYDSAEAYRIGNYMLAQYQRAYAV